MDYLNVVSATFVSRYNRFIATVHLDGHNQQVHINNSGNCSGLFTPGTEVFLAAPQNGKRKTNHDLFALRKENGKLVNIDATAGSKLVENWLSSYKFDRMMPTYTVGRSVYDFYIQHTPKDKDPEQIYIDTDVCLTEQDGIAHLYDIPAQRIIDRLHDLRRICRKGSKAFYFIILKVEGVTEFTTDTLTDPKVITAVKDAQNAGVEIMALPCTITTKRIEINSDLVNLPFI